MKIFSPELKDSKIRNVFVREESKKIIIKELVDQKRIPGRKRRSMYINLFQRFRNFPNAKAPEKNGMVYYLIQ